MLATDRCPRRLALIRPWRVTARNAGPFSRAAASRQARTGHVAGLERPPSGLHRRGDPPAPDRRLRDWSTYRGAARAHEHAAAARPRYWPQIRLRLSSAVTPAGREPSEARSAEPSAAATTAHADVTAWNATGTTGDGSLVLRVYPQVIERQERPEWANAVPTTTATPRIGCAARSGGRTIPSLRRSPSPHPGRCCSLRPRTRMLCLPGPASSPRRSVRRVAMRSPCPRGPGLAAVSLPRIAALGGWICGGSSTRFTRATSPGWRPTTVRPPTVSPH